MKKHSPQQGSAHVIVTICLVLGLITALGWIFYQNFILKEPVQKDTELVVVDKSKDDQKDANKDGEKTNEAEPAYKGKRITPLGGAYSVKIPNGWELINNNTDDEYFGKNYLTTGPGLGKGADDTVGKIAYDESKSPVIKYSQLGGWGGFAEIFTINAQTHKQGDDAKITKFKLDDGTVGKKYEYVAPADPDRGVYATEYDFYTYNYVFTKNSKTVSVNFSIFSNNKSKYDQELIENTIRSIEIK